MSTRSFPGLVALMLVLASGCASTPGVTLRDDTLMLGEVRHVLTRELLQSGRLAPADEPHDLSNALKAHGWTDAQLDSGRIVVVRVAVYWNNTASGIVRDRLGLALSLQDRPLQRGTVVEFTAAGEVRRIRAAALADGTCYYGNVPVGEAVELLGGLSGVGPRGSASLYCRGIELEGWHRPRTYWHKLPDAVPGAGPIDGPPAEVRLQDGR